MTYLIVDFWEFVRTQLFEILIDILIRQIAAEKHTMDCTALTYKPFQSADSLAPGEELV